MTSFDDYATVPEAAAEYRRQADIEDADSANYKTGIGYK